jgi:hypothetical protein
VMQFNNDGRGSRTCYNRIFRSIHLRSQVIDFGRDVAIDAKSPR